MGAASQAGHATCLDGVPFSFAESLSGRFRPTRTDSFPRHAAPALPDDRIRVDLRIRIPDLGRFLRDLRHGSELSGSLFLPCLGGTIPIECGRIEMFTVDPRTGRRQIVYEFRFRAPDGQVYCFHGHKDLSHDPWRVDIGRDLTRLFATIHAGSDCSGPVYGTGELRFRLIDAPRLIASMRVDTTSSWRRRAAARIAFLSVAEGALRDEYCRGVRLFYDAGYENLVLSGTALCERRSEPTSFFLVSGVHSKGFPWGDGELFSDLLLVIGSRSNGRRRYCIADRLLDGLDLDVTRGTCTYSGPIAAVSEGYATSFADLTGSTGVLTRLHAEIDVRFEARAGHAVPFPFPRTNRLLRRVRSGLSGWLARALPGTHLPGIHLTPHAVTVTSGSIRIRDDAGAAWSGDWVIMPELAFGECERGSFRNLKRPVLAYRYVCAVDAGRRSAAVRICASTLHRRRRGGSLIDRVVSRVGSTTYVVSDEGVHIGAGHPSTRRPGDEPTIRPQPVLEISHGQFPTAVFLRRVVEIEEGSRGCRLALEEDMSP